MKNIHNIKGLMKWLLPAVLPLSVISCTEEEPLPGTPDLENCYGVYFLEETGNTGEIEVSPSGEKTLTFTLLRLKDDDAITVPLTIDSNYPGIFSATEAKFEDGQSETTFTVSFPDVEKGPEYTCKVSIDDPLYALRYGKYPTSMEFSVSVVQWNRITGTGKWRDDFISSLYTSVSNAYAEKDIVMYERDDRPGYYRIGHVYTRDYVALLFYGDASYSSAVPACEETYTYVDATDPDKVYLPAQRTGMTLSAADGAISMASDVPEVFGEQSAGVYGTLENGVITFPQFAILGNFAGEPDSWYSANMSANARIILPGYRAYDYSVTLSAGQTSTSTGLLPVTFTLGQDIRSARWAIYEGRLSETDAASLARSLPSDARAVTSSGAVGVAPESGKTGVYTLVAAGYDRYGTYQGYAFVSFSYMSPSDPVGVVVSGGLIVSDKYAPQGYTKENSLEFYIYGKDLEEVRVALIKTSDASGLTFSEFVSSMQSYIEPLSAARLDSLNTVGYTGVVGDLVAGTEYGLYILSSNGYQTALNIYTASTEGTPDPLYREYDINDMLTEQPSSAGEYFKEWNYYAVDGFDDLFGNNARREKVGTVTIADSSYPDEGEYDYVTFNGIFGSAAEDFGMQEGTDMLFYRGYFFELATMLSPVNVSGMTMYPVFATASTSGAVSINGTTLLGGLVDDGYLAFVDSGMSSEYVFDGIFVMAFRDAALSNPAGGLVYYKNLLFVDPSVDKGLPESGASSSGTSSFVTMESLKSVWKEFNGPAANYVETPEGRFCSIVDRLNERKFRNYMNVSLPVHVVPESGPVKAISAPVQEGGAHDAAGMDRRQDAPSRKMMR